MNTLPIRPVITIVLAFAVLCSSLVVLDRRNLLEPVRDGLTTVVAPISDTFGNVTNREGHRSGLENELATMTAERDALLGENSQLKDDLREYEQLRQQQEVASQNPGLTYSKSPAEVMNRDPNGTQKFLIINQGSRDGITVGAAVVDPYFYVGQVVEVSERTAKVMLLIDTSQKVGAMLVDSRADGVVYGQWQNGGVMVMRNIETDKVPKAGELIVTSGFSESQTANVPANLPIGQVVGDPATDAQNDQVQVDVRPGRGNFDDIDVVWVVTDNAQQ